MFYSKTFNSKISSYETTYWELIQENKSSLLLSTLMLIQPLNATSGRNFWAICKLHQNEDIHYTKEIYPRWTHKRLTNSLTSELFTRFETISQEKSYKTVIDCFFNFFELWMCFINARLLNRLARDHESTFCMWTRTSDLWVHTVSHSKWWLGQSERAHKPRAHNAPWKTGHCWQHPRRELWCRLSWSQQKSTECIKSWIRTEIFVFRLLLNVSSN